MSRTVAKTLGGFAFVVLVSLGVAPLVQWFIFDHANGPIAILFADPEEPWVWILPILVCGVAALVMVVCGVSTDDGHTSGTPDGDEV